MRLSHVCVAVLLIGAMGQACGGDDVPSTGTNGGTGGTGGHPDASNAGASGRGGAGTAGTGGSGATSGTGGTAGRGGTSGTGGGFDGGGASGAGNGGAPSDGGGRAGTGVDGAPTDGSTGSGGASIDGSGGLGGADGATGGVAGAGGAGVGDASTDGASGASDAATDGAGDSGGTADADGASGGDASGESGVSCGDASIDKRIFVSSVLYMGNLGGLTGADAKCQALADAAGLCGTFKAWLSDATADAAARLSHATGTYVRTDGQIVANGWSGLVSGTIQNAINRTETNGAAPVGTVKCGGSAVVPVWTGSTAAGANVMNGSCSNWASNTASPGGIFGNADAKNFAWTAMCQIVAVCQSTAAIYCVEQ